MADIALDVQSAPTTPAAGVGVVYVDSSTKKLATKDDAGTVVAYGAAIATPVTVANGGTGDTSLTSYAVLTGGTTSTSAVQSVASVGTSGQVLTSNGAGALPTFQATGSGSVDNSVVDFRLTLTSVTPVTTADVGGATTIYCSPYKGNRIALYDGSNWNIRASAEFSIALGTLTSGLPYDVFCYDNATVPTLEILAWTSTTARATALVLQDGILSKTGALTRRYLGTFYTSSTTTTEDTDAKRFLWNYYNRVQRKMKVFESTSSWTYTTSTWRQARATTTNQLDFIIGWDEVVVDASVGVSYGNGSGASAEVSIGLDSTTTPSADCLLTVGPPINGTNAGISNRYVGRPGIGRHILVWLEFSSNVGTTTFYAASGLTANNTSGIIGWTLC